MSFGDLIKRAETPASAIVRLALFAGSAVSCFYVGFFSQIGFDMMALLSKRSLIEAILFYAAQFSLIMAMVTLLSAALKPEERPQPDALPVPLPPPTKRALFARMLPNPLKLLSSSKAVVPAVKVWQDDLLATLRSMAWALGISASILVLLLVGPVYGLSFVALATCIGFLLRQRSAKLGFATALILCALLGGLRGHFLWHAPADVDVTLGSLQNSHEEARILIAADNGVILGMGPPASRRAAFVPWDRIDRIEHRGISYFSWDHMREAEQTFRNFLQPTARLVKSAP